MWVVRNMPQPLYPLERDLVPIVQEAEWTTGLVWTGVKSLPIREFKPQTAQLIAGHYIACAIMAA
jgi:hypothetical protein